MKDVVQFRDLSSQDIINVPKREVRRVLKTLRQGGLNEQEAGFIRSAISTDLPNPVVVNPRATEFLRSLAV